MASRVVRLSSFSGRAPGELADDVELPDVPRVFLEQVEQDSLQRGRLSAVPAFARLADLVEVMGLDNGPCARSASMQFGH
jgi:hypothetical protein